MSRDKSSVPILRGKLAAFVENELHRRTMRFQQQIRNYSLSDQFRLLRLRFGIEMMADVAVGKSVKPPFPNVCEVVRRQIIAQVASFHHGCPQLAGLRSKPDAYAIALA